MRILLLTQFFDPEPAAIPGMPLATWLRGRGHDVEVVTGFPNYPGGRFYPGYQPSGWRVDKMDGVRVNRVPLYPSHDRSGIRRSASYISFGLTAASLGWTLSNRADAVYVYHPPATSAFPAIVWKHLRRMPFIFHVQDLWPDSVVDSGMVGSGWKRRLVERSTSWWCSLVYRQASHLAVLSPGFKRLLTDRGVDESRIEVVYNWTDETLFRPLEPDLDLARRLTMLGRFNVVYSGNVGHYQGLDAMLKAAHRLRHLQQIHLMIIGSGQAEQHLRRQAAELGLTNVSFLGRWPFSEMGRLTALADALLISLEDRPFFAATIPGKTQVAMACGRPIIMSVRGDAADLVRRAGAGVTCEPGDDAALAQAIHQLYRLSPDDRAAMGARARDFYERELSLNSGAARLERLLLRAAGRRDH